MYSFKDSKELLTKCHRHKASISEIVILYEMDFTKKKRVEVMKKMKKARQVMQEAVDKSIYRPETAAFGMAGHDAAKLYQAIKTHKRMASSHLVLKAMAYATATGETNVSMGRIVAFPTAGGAGVVPGVILSAAEEWKLSEEKVLKALFAAAGIGMVIAQNATLSAAAAGCQAEVGAAVAMAAAGLTELRGGTPEEAINAAALALKSYLGLVCDPLGGLVAIPCIKRNTLGASMACAASDASVSGIKSFIPFDEVVQSMNNIAKLMSPRLRETALGGLAVTKTGLMIRRKLGLPDLKKSDL